MKTTAVSWLDVGSSHFHSGEGAVADWFFGQPFEPSEFLLENCTVTVNGNGETAAELLKENKQVRVRFNPGQDGFYHLLCQGSLDNKLYTAQMAVAAGHFHGAAAISLPQDAALIPPETWRQWHRDDQVCFGLKENHKELFLAVKGSEGLCVKQLPPGNEVCLHLDTPGKYLLFADGGQQLSSFSFWVLK